jgi:energy-coupling factor transport system substrate-specific component
LVVVSGIGLLAFLFPFLVLTAPDARNVLAIRAVAASLLLGVIVAAALVMAVGEIVRSPATGDISRSVALLGALIGLDSALRLIPSFLGASPIFALIILVGWVFGARFGFAMGALTLLVSAAITAGVGPWLPYQMLCAGWTGAAAGWLNARQWPVSDTISLAGFGAVAGFAYGALMNLFSWPFAAPGLASDAGLYWNPALSLPEAIERYATFYVTTSLLHDATRAAATALLILVAGAPVLRLLRRFQQRATWDTDWTPAWHSAQRR